MADSALQVEWIENVTVVTFRDASILNTSIVESVANELYKIVGQTACRRLILDFSKVQFLSSQMLGVLIGLQQKAQAAACEILICGLCGELQRVFKVMNLHRMLRIVEHEAEALRRFGITCQA